MQIEHCASLDNCFIMSLSFVALAMIGRDEWWPLVDLKFKKYTHYSQLVIISEDKNITS
jgi:hypothetical protein